MALLNPAIVDDDWVFRGEAGELKSHVLIMTLVCVSCHCLGVPDWRAKDLMPEFQVLNSFRPGTTNHVVMFVGTRYC